MSNHRPAATTCPPEQRDYALEQLWNKFADIPMDPETECMEAQFLHFPVGTERETIWHWFDERYSKGVVDLLYGGTENQVSQIGQPQILKELCPVCEYGDCAFNCSGTCYVSLIYGQMPQDTKGVECRKYIQGDGS